MTRDSLTPGTGQEKETGHDTTSGTTQYVTTDHMGHDITRDTINRVRAAPTVPLPGTYWELVQGKNSAERRERVNTRHHNTRDTTARDTT